MSRARVLVASALGYWLVGCTCQDPHRTYGPNIVLVVVDTVRADHLGTYGYTRQTDAAMQAFSAKSTRFTHAYSHAPWTKPSVATMLTSKLPRDHGVRAWEDTLPPDVLTLAEVLKLADYRTEAYVSHHALSPEDTQLDRGFDVFDISAYEGTDPHKATSAHKVSDLGIAALDRWEPGVPSFLMLHYFDPHNYYQKHDEFPFGGQRIDKYDAEIAYTDLHLGRFLKHLEDSGHLEDTIVVITADHGEAFGEHGIRLHTTDLHDELIRVPLLIRVPGLAPSTEAHTVGHMALTPTLLSLVGLPIPTSFEGQPMGVVRGSLGLKADRQIFSATTHEADKRSVVSGDHKVIRDFEHDTWLFYDLGADPKELLPLQPDPTHEALKAAILAEEDKPPRAAGKAPMSDKQREILEELGYLEADPADPADPGE